MPTITGISRFATDTIKGLTCGQKYLLPRYLYDDNGSRIFQQIMHMPEYYLTDCEQEIFEKRGNEIARHLMPGHSFFRLIELGPGDGLKSRILLKALLENSGSFNYMPVDISSQAINSLINSLRKDLIGLKINELIGDYFHVLKKELSDSENIPGIILFLGANIGNFTDQELDEFLGLISEISKPGDKVLIGFDLKKSPDLIMRAYDDPHGYTREFNLNHLQRINSELNANFEIDEFDHHCSYNPQSGEMNSFLVSRKNMKVHIEALQTDIFIRKWESIFMELSRKYDLQQIGVLAEKYGFMVEKTFMDPREYFADTLWIKKTKK